jgi:hypothetical protein
MRKRVIHIALLALMAALLAPAGSASGAPLTEDRARDLALKLGRQVAKERDALSWRISDPVKVRSNRVVFVYSERGRDEGVCSADLVVRQSGNRYSADLVRSRCAPIPQEALAIERAVTEVLRRLKEKGVAVRDSVRAYELEAEECESLSVPRAQRANVDGFIDAGLELAIYEPVLAELADYVAALEGIGVKDATLTSGVVAWRRYLRLLDALPDVARDACPEVRRWAAGGYDADSAPVDFRELRATLAGFVRQDKRMTRAADRLYELVISRKGLNAFFPYGVVTLAAAESR